MSQKFSLFSHAWLLFCMLMSGLVQAQEVRTDKKDAPSDVVRTTSPMAGTPASLNQASPSSPNAVTRGLVGQGVLKCASRVEQVSNFLNFGPMAGAMLLPASQDVDNRLAHFVLESPTPDGSAYVSATFAPNQSNGCGATYDAVMYWPKGCDALATQQFDKFKRVGTLKKNVLVLDGGVGTKIFLLTAGSGCVSVKKEVVL